MADKDKKLRVILKLPGKSSTSTAKSSIHATTTHPPAAHQSSSAPPSSHHHHAHHHVAAPQTPAPPAGMSHKSAAAASSARRDHITAPANLASGVGGGGAGGGSSSSSHGRVATPPKKRKFKTLVDGDARDGIHNGGGVYGGSSAAAVTAANGVTAPSPAVFKAPLPPLAKKPSHKKKEKPINSETGERPGAGRGQVSTVPPPAKKVLEGILDKLKKKDTYGVFSEPVDSRLVPDYYDVIKDPMDFGTMYKKISKGVYQTLALFEKDIMLICSNAMRYNGPDTIYYKQARSIQDAARKALEVVAAQAGVPEAVKLPTSHKKQPHTAKKGWKNTAAVKSLLEPANSDFASGATLAAEGDEVARVKGGPLKKGAPSDRSGSVVGEESGWGVQSHGSTGLEPDPDLQDEQGSGPTLKAPTLKDGRRPLSTDEYHRSSYKPRNLPALGRGPPIAGVGGELFHLVPTGYQAEFAYAKSLSQFASKLGPDGWKVAARRLQRVLAPSVPFGQGWIGEHEAPPGTIFKSSLADKKVVNAAANTQVSATSIPSSQSGPSSTSHAPAMASSFVHTPKSSRAPMTSVAQTSMDSLLTTVTSAMLASGVSSQTMLPGKPTLDTSKSKATQPAYQLEHSRGPGVPSSSEGLTASTGRPVWTSQPPASQPVKSTSGFVFKSMSESANVVSSRWAGSTSQPGPTFVYSTAVRAVPTSTSVSGGQDDASKAQAHSLGLLQADANARAKMQGTVHLSQAPRPVQNLQQPMYTNMPSYGLQPGSLRVPFVPNHVVMPSQPFPSSKQEFGSVKAAASQPLQLQTGSLVNNYGQPPRPGLNPIAQQQQQQQQQQQHHTQSSRPPPDLNLQPLDSPSTPQASGQLNSLGGPTQPSLSLQL